MRGRDLSLVRKSGPFRVSRGDAAGSGGGWSRRPRRRTPPRPRARPRCRRWRSDEARREARPFLELDLGGVVGEVVGEGRKPPLVDDDEARDGAPATRRPPFEALAEAPRAHGRRRQEGAVALRAPRELEHVLAAPVPERAVVRGHPGLGLYRHIHVLRAPFSRGRRSSRPTPSPTGGASRPGSAVPPLRRGVGGRSPRSSSSR